MKWKVVSDDLVSPWTVERKCSGIELMIINYMCVIFRFSRVQSVFVGGNMVIC